MGIAITGPRATELLGGYGQLLASRQPVKAQLVGEPQRRGRKKAREKHFDYQKNIVK